MINVEARAIAGWVAHSTHHTIRDAIDQADLIHGRIVCEDVRVCGGENDDYDEGWLDHITDSGKATVRWDSGVVTPADPDDLRVM